MKTLRFLGMTLLMELVVITKMTNLSLILLLGFGLVKLMQVLKMIILTLWF